MAETRDRTATMAVKPKSEAELIRIGRDGVELDTVPKQKEYARLIVEAGLAPRGMNAAAVCIIFEAGRKAGLGPLEALNSGFVVNGNFAWKGTAAAAMIRKRDDVCVPGTLKFWGEGEGDKMKGVAVAQRVGYKEPQRCEFSVADARRAGLWGKGGAWNQFPKRMLMWRALGLLARDLFFDVLMGYPITHEAADFEPSPPSRPPITAKPEGPAPSGPDPLLAALDVTPGEDGIFAAKAEAAAKEEEGHSGHSDPAMYPGTEGTHYAGKELCEHGTPDGDFCQQCSVEMDQVAAEDDGQMGLLE